MFGEMMHDLTWHKFLALRVRLRGSPRTRNSYFVNIQTDGYITTDLWQHRLYFQRDDGEWEDVYVRAFCPLLFVLKIKLLKIPLSSFVLTNSGEIVDTQMEMRRSHIRTVGISLLGGKGSIEGSYELGIENIRAVNTENATKARGTFVDFRKNWTS
jgi:NADH dehydrogenase [ubiquinone] 1 alpha subcomplex assembly factor 1